MDHGAHNALLLNHTLQKQDRKWEMRWEDDEAKLGWTKAQHAKKLRRLEGELDQNRQDKAYLEAELRVWRSKFDQLDAEYAALKEDANILPDHPRVIEGAHLLSGREQALEFYGTSAPQTSVMAFCLCHA